MANKRERRGRRKRRRKSGADFINSMPDEILHHILSFLPTYLAISTSVLSRRWRYVWCETPSLYIDNFRFKVAGINQTLTSYTAPKITSFKLHMSLDRTAPPQVDSWIEFAISRSVQKLSVSIIGFCDAKAYRFPDSFYLSSSVKQLTVNLVFCDMIIPSCTVSWKSLRKFSLLSCKLPDKTIDNILYGCPILESLSLDTCRLLERLDLSNSPSLRRLNIDRHPGPIVIVAPHIHYLRLTSPSTLVDVSSLTEANLNIISSSSSSILGRYQTMALEMLAKSHNVEKLTVEKTLLRILSLAELRGVPFPTLKVQTLILKTESVPSVISSISRLLQNSHGLKKLTLHTMHIHDIMDMHLLKGLYPDQCWRSKCEVLPASKEIYTMLGCNYASKLLALFIELLRNAKTLETMVIWLRGSCFNDAQQWFEELLQMVKTSNNNNVSIVFKPSNC